MILNIIGHKLFFIGLIFGIFYIGLLISVDFFQSRLIYYPNREIAATPDDIGLPYENVIFESEDKIKLHGWFIPCEKSKDVVLFCHGNGGNISYCIDFIKIFYNLGLSTFIFDYRGYGQSKGKATEKGTYLDAEASWNYLVQKRKINPENIIVFGHSLGGSIACWLAQSRKAKVLILESVFTSVPDLGVEIYPFLPVRLLSRFNYTTIDYIKRVKYPVLIVHSRQDEMISFKHGQKLFEAANEPKEFLEIKGDHNYGFMLTGKNYEDGLNSFISKYNDIKN